MRPSRESARSLLTSGNGPLPRFSRLADGERILLSQCDAQGKGGKTVVTRRAGNEPGVWKHRLCHRFCVAKPATLAMGLIEDAND